MNWTDKEQEEQQRFHENAMALFFGPEEKQKFFTEDGRQIDYKTKEAPGGRDDSAKLRYDLIPPEAMEELAKVLTFGAKKYADRNWEKGMDWGRVFGSLMRHLWKWWSPFHPDTDDETGFSHLSHALTNIAFLLTYEKRGVGNDNRN